jgi:hypothetical protein
VTGRRTGPRAISLLLGLCLGRGIGAAEDRRLEISGSTGFEGQYFPSRPQFPGQFEHADASVFTEFEFSWGWRDGDLSLTVVPFFRVDAQDQERTHFDLREAVVQWVTEPVDVRVGLYRVFWGVAESAHLVDIVNQTDLVDDIDGEEKLGQPMIEVLYRPDWRGGTFDLFLMPHFRERTLQGVPGRFRFGLPYAPDETEFESSEGKRHLDAALRYQLSLGGLDLGVSAFHGTGREPRFLVAPDALIPFYDVIDQAGVDVQVTAGDWLWKGEGFWRSGNVEPFGAFVGGFEYTFVGVLGSAADVGLLAEYHYDGRPIEAPPILFQDDLFVGTRIGFNDVQSTQILAGLTVGLDGGTLASLEFSRRIGASWKLDVVIRNFAGTGTLALGALQQDDYAQAAMVYYY